ncbi:MAG: GNAT family N-acetyltransferase [Butyrivibrio sp.]
MTEIIQVKKGQKEILKNLLEKYDYEFSQWNNLDVNELGLYGYDYLDCYWTDPNRWAYFIYVDGKIAGFAMVNDYPEDEKAPSDYTMSEFCILFKYRRRGIGKEVAFKIFDMHRGKWQLQRHPHNIPSVHFWNNVINEYTNGNYVLKSSHPEISYDDKTAADVFYFDNTI